MMAKASVAMICDPPDSEQAGPPARSEAEELPAEGLRLLRLFLSIGRKADRDQVVHLVDKFVEKLKEKK
jgi:hypothetical protein